MHVDFDFVGDMIGLGGNCRVWIDETKRYQEGFEQNELEQKRLEQKVLAHGCSTRIPDFELTTTEINAEV